MNLDQAFRSTVTSLVYVFQGLHIWHRGSRRIGLALCLLLEARVFASEQLEQQSIVEVFLT